jgi:RsiW-degrading membrane proteinase PrsW (M82 family)
VNLHLLVGTILLGTLLLIGLLPALALVLLVRWMDRYEREPLWLVLVAFSLGGTVSIAFGGFANGFTQVYLAHHLGDSLARTATIVFSAPVFEEIGKLIVILLLARSQNFDGPVDGIVYGSAVGLGFGAVENFFYFLDSARSGPLVLALVIVLRTIYTLLLHQLCASCSGSAVGIAKISGLGFFRKRLVVSAGLLSAMGLHFLGNSLSVFSRSQGAPQWILMNVLGCFFFLGLLFMVFQLELLKESHILQKELEPEVSREILSSQELWLLTHYRQRLRRHLALLFTLQWRHAWRLHSFAQVAGQLALRKYRAREVPGLEEEIDSLRQELKERLRGW